MVATWPRRTISLPRRFNTICSNSAGDLDAAHQANALFVQRPLMRPTGAVVFCARNAATTSGTDTLNSRNFSARNNTDSSRFQRAAHVHGRHSIDAPEFVGQGVLGQARNLGVRLRCGRAPIA